MKEYYYSQRMEYVALAWAEHEGFTEIFMMMHE